MWITHYTPCLPYVTSMTCGPSLDVFSLLCMMDVPTSLYSTSAHRLRGIQQPWSFPLPLWFSWHFSDSLGILLLWSLSSDHVPLASVLPRPQSQAFHPLTNQGLWMAKGAVHTSHTVDMGNASINQHLSSNTEERFKIVFPTYSVNTH